MDIDYEFDFMKSASGKDPPHAPTMKRYDMLSQDAPEAPVAPVESDHEDATEEEWKAILTTYRWALMHYKKARSDVVEALTASVPDDYQQIIAVPITNMDRSLHGSYSINTTRPMMVGAWLI